MSRILKWTNSTLLAIGLLALVACSASQAVVVARIETVLTVASEIADMAALFGAGPAATAVAAGAAMLEKLLASFASGTVSAAGGTEAQAYHDVVVAYAALPEQFREAITAVSLAHLQALDAAANAPTSTDADVAALAAALDALEPALRAQLAVARATMPPPVETLP